MKPKFIAFFFLFISTGVTLYAQTPDTIYISSSTSVYLTFDDKVDLLNISSKEYAYQVNGNVVMLKVNSAAAPPTSIFARAGDYILTAFLAYRENADQIFYDFREGSHASGSSSSYGGRDFDSEEPLGRADLRDIEAKAVQIIDFKPRLKFYGEKKDNILFSVVDVVADKRVVFIKLRIKNKSAMDYYIDYISFRIKNKGLFGTRAGKGEQIEPVFETVPERAKSGDTVSLIYAFPLYAGNSKTEIEIIMRERGGTRTLTAKLPAKELINAPLY